MDNQGQRGASRPLLVIMTFAMLCAAVLLGTLALTPPTSIPEESPRSCPSDAARQALEDTARADLALRENNFGAAQVHVQRARVRLEAAVAEMSPSDE